MSKNNFDAIIIGGGCGGLGAAAKLVSAGKRVLLLERNSFLGGRCSSYKKQGFTIDLGTHIITRCEFGPIGHVLKLIQENVKFYHLKRMPFYFLTLDGAFGPFGIDIDAKYGSILPPDEEIQKLNVEKSDFKDLLTKMSNLLSGLS
ncbi:MAG: FAD-dependent oxidoreductase, partial [Candidatus Helarchaeota archaeon]